MSVHYSFHYLSYLSRVYLFFSYISRAGKEELRKVEDEFEEKELDDVEEREKEEEPPRKDFRYYFNRFRYYHYWIAEKVDKFIAFVCMWIFKIMLFIIGVKVDGLPSIDEIGESSLNFDNNAN